MKDYLGEIIASAATLIVSGALKVIYAKACEAVGWLQQISIHMENATKVNAEQDKRLDMHDIRLDQHEKAIDEHGRILTEHGQIIGKLTRE